MLEKCKMCPLRSVHMVTNDELFDICIAKQYPCDMIDRCEYVVTITSDEPSAAQKQKDILKDIINCRYLNKGYTKYTELEQLNALQSILQEMERTEH